MRHITNNNINLSNIVVEEKIVNEIRGYKNATGKIYKFILLLSLVDYLEDSSFEVDQFINREIKLVEFVDYYRIYLENETIKETAFSDKTNIEIIKRAEMSIENIKRYNNLFISNMQTNPIRHMHDSTFLVSDDVKIKGSNGKYSRNKKHLATYVKLVNTFNVSNEVFINSIKVGAILKIREILKSDTIVVATAKTRVGQQIYRRKLLEKYDCKCAICGESFIPLLVASHAKPWVKCDSVHEKLSEHNGLLLCSNHDSLFDKGYITINVNTKEIIINHAVSGHIKSSTPKYFEKTIDNKMLKYLKYHNDIIFKGV